MASRLARFVALALCAAAVAGCGGGGSETVSGVVTLDGAPLPAAYLMLIPNDPAIKGPFLGKTDDQGEYSMGSIDDPGGGVPAGQYRMSITTAHADSVDETTVLPPQRVPQPYPAGVDFEVPDGGKSDANFDLKSK